jgi:hypothetical protein
MFTPQELIKEAYELLASAEQIQDDSQSEQERKEVLEQVRVAYRTWYHKSLGLFANANRLDLQQSFKKEYEGGLINQKIEKFLSSGWQIYSLYDPDKPNPIIPFTTVQKICAEATGVGRDLFEHLICAALNGSIRCVG